VATICVDAVWWTTRQPRLDEQATTPDALEDLDFWWNTMILMTMR
jgi:hypothetical protein